ncbi:MAG TPA: cyclase dehydrase [Afifellaceae bacterium]|nr:cyclase dehydrase [Afifellaceae bacterium]
MAYAYRSSRGDGRGSAEMLARGLGWFSIGLGLAELLGARSINRTLGTGDHDLVVRAYGLREIATGVGILTQENPRPWVWARVAGDLLDLASLAPALGQDNPQRDKAAVAFGNVALVTALDVGCALVLPEPLMKPVADYSDRSGFPRPAHAMRGVAGDVEPPPDMREPEAMRGSVPLH